MMMMMMCCCSKRTMKCCQLDHNATSSMHYHSKHRRVSRCQLHEADVDRSFWDPAIYFDAYELDKWAFIVALLPL